MQCELDVVNVDCDEEDGDDVEIENDPHYYEEDDIPYVSKEIDVQNDLPNINY